MAAETATHALVHMPSILYLASRHPSLLVDHAEAYIDLAAQDLSKASQTWKRRTLLYAMALCCFGVGAVLCGTSILLWVLALSASTQAIWTLVLLPLVPLAVGFGCLHAARQHPHEASFTNLRRHLSADAMVLRDAIPT